LTLLINASNGSQSRGWRRSRHFRTRSFHVQLTSLSVLKTSHKKNNQTVPPKMQAHNRS
jgi:hypothetical protein